MASIWLQMLPNGGNSASRKRPIPEMPSAHARLPFDIDDRIDPTMRQYGCDGAGNPQADGADPHGYQPVIAFWAEPDLSVHRNSCPKNLNRSIVIRVKNIVYRTVRGNAPMFK